MELTLDQALQKGIQAHKAGKAQEADRYYTAILRTQPKHPDANHNMGVLAVGVGKVQEALPFFRIALEINPKIEQFWLSYIDALIKLDQIDDAKAAFDESKKNGLEGDRLKKLKQRLPLQIRAKSDSKEIKESHSNILDKLKLHQAISLAEKKIRKGYISEARDIYQDVIVKFPKNKKALDAVNALSKVVSSEVKKLQEPPKNRIQLVINLYEKGLFNKISFLNE